MRFISLFSGIGGFDLGLEQLQFQMPDGELVTAKLKEDSRSYTISDMGVPYDTSDTTYYFEVEWHGQMARMYVAGLMARRKW